MALDIRPGASISTRDAYGHTLVDLGAERDDIVVLDADIAKSTTTFRFAKAYPDRFFNMGIAEQDMMGTAAGLATCGLTPFVSTYSVFATMRALEQVRTAIAYPGLGVKIAVTHGGLAVGMDGVTHQAHEDLAIMRAIPGMRVLVPLDAVETVAMVRWAAAAPGPVFLRLGRPAGPVLLPLDFTYDPSQPAVLRAAPGGRADVVILVNGILAPRALSAADELAAGGAAVTVINASTLKPFPAAALLEHIRPARAVVTVEDHSIVGGLGGAAAELLGEHCPKPLRRVGIPDVFGESGPPDELYAAYGMDVKDIVEAARSALQTA